MWELRTKSAILHTRMSHVSVIEKIFCLQHIT